MWVALSFYVQTLSFVIYPVLPFVETSFLSVFFIWTLQSLYLVRCCCKDGRPPELELGDQPWGSCATRRINRSWQRNMDQGPHNSLGYSQGGKDPSQKEPQALESSDFDSQKQKNLS